MGVFRPGEGGEEEKKSREEEFEAGPLIEKEDGDEDGERDFKVVENGQRGRIYAGRSGIPKKETEAGSDRPKVGEGDPLGG